MKSPLSHTRMALLRERTAKALASEILKPIGDDMQAMLDEIDRLSVEVDALRQYGNKSCTAQADEALENGYPA